MQIQSTPRKCLRGVYCVPETREVSLSSRPQTRKRCNLFFPAACTSEKTLLGLQTCEPSVADGGAVRCSRPHPLKKVAFATFLTVNQRRARKLRGVGNENT
jgi:hypothetical protein